MKTDFSGNIKWAKSYQSIISGPNCLDCPAQGIYGGADSSYYFINGNCLAFGRIIRTDIKGNIIWAKGLGLIPMEIINVKDKGFLILGNGPLCGIAPGSLSSQIRIIKTDSAVNSPDCIFNFNANMANDSMLSSDIILNSINSSKDSIFQPQINSISISAYPGCVNTIPGIKETKLNTMITLYPNPSKGIFTLKASEAGPSEIFIYNSLGEMIYQSEMNSRQLQIALIAKARGIYFYKVILADKKFSSGLICLTIVLLINSFWVNFYLLIIIGFYLIGINFLYVAIDYIFKIIFRQNAQFLMHLILQSSKTHYL